MGKDPHLIVEHDPVAFLGNLKTWRKDLRSAIAASLSEMDPSVPETLQSAVAAMFEAHYKPKTLSKVLGPSQTTIARWAEGATIPRSAPYRKWLVEELIAFLKKDETDSNSCSWAAHARESVKPKSVRPKRPEAKKASLRKNSPR